MISTSVMDQTVKSSSLLTFCIATRALRLIGEINTAGWLVLGCELLPSFSSSEEIGVEGKLSGLGLGSSWIGVARLVERARVAVVAARPRERPRGGILSCVLANQICQAYIPTD